MTVELITGDEDIDAINDIIDGIDGVIDGVLRDHMLSAFAYLIASNLNSDEDARIVMTNFVEQVCEGYKAIKAQRTMN